MAKTSKAAPAASKEAALECGRCAEKGRETPMEAVNGLWRCPSCRHTEHE